MRITSLILILALLAGLLGGCASREDPADIAATTLPVYEFTEKLCAGTGLTVTRLVTENVSCLHDYSLNVRQVKAAEAAKLIVINGAGLEEFMEDILEGKQTIDASAGIELLQSCHHHAHDEHDEHHHGEEADGHIWLSPDNASIMASNIYSGLCRQFPEHAETFKANLTALLSELDTLSSYGREQLASLQTQEVITFHDGFAYFAQWCGFEIAKAIEEESGAEASASELIEIIGLVHDHGVRAIFTETNGSTSAAAIIAAETGAAVYTLDMAMSGDSWFDAMYHNIDTIKEALG